MDHTARPPPEPCPGACLVVGAGDGLGAAVSRAFAAEGLEVCVTRRTRSPGTTCGCTGRAGLDGAALLARTQASEVKAELAANTEAAVTRGVFGVPSFLVGDALFFGKERPGQVVEAATA